mgnify:CR=1 FL=1
MLIKLVKFNLFCLLLVAGELIGNNASAQEPIFNEQLCLLNVELISEPTNKTQRIDLNKEVAMVLTNAVAVNKNLGIHIASNTTCQQMLGASYTGSKAEWANFFDSALTGLLKAGFKELQLTLVGENDKIFNSPLTKTLIAKEYVFTGEIGDNKQIIKNLALLDKTNNTIYTFSVSGNVASKEGIIKEYKRLLVSIKLAE